MPNFHIINNFTSAEILSLGGFSINHGNGNDNDNATS